MSRCFSKLVATIASPEAQAHVPTRSEASGRNPGRRDWERALGTAWRAQAGAITPRLDRPPGGWGRVQHDRASLNIAVGPGSTRCNAQALAGLAVAVTAVGTASDVPMTRPSPAPAWPISPEWPDGMGGGARRTAFPGRPEIGPCNSTPGFPSVTGCLPLGVPALTAAGLTPARLLQREALCKRSVIRSGRTMDAVVAWPPRRISCAV